MVFEIEYWKDRLETAKTQTELSQLLKELPDNPASLVVGGNQKSSSETNPENSEPLILNTRKGWITVG